MIKHRTNKLCRFSFLLLLCFCTFLCQIIFVMMMLMYTHNFMVYIKNVNFPQHVLINSTLLLTTGKTRADEQATMKEIICALNGNSWCGKKNMGEMRCAF